MEKTSAKAVPLKRRKNLEDREIETILDLVLTPPKRLKKSRNIYVKNKGDSCTVSENSRVDNVGEGHKYMGVSRVKKNVLNYQMKKVKKLSKSQIGLKNTKRSKKGLVSKTRKLTYQPVPVSYSDTSPVSKKSPLLGSPSPVLSSYVFNELEPQEKRDLEWPSTVLSPQPSNKVFRTKVLNMTPSPKSFHSIKSPKAHLTPTLSNGHAFISFKTDPMIERLEEELGNNNDKENESLLVNPPTPRSELSDVECVENSTPHCVSSIKDQTLITSSPKNLFQSRLRTPGTPKKSPKGKLYKFSLEQMHSAKLNAEQHMANHLTIHQQNNQETEKCNRDISPCPERRSPRKSLNGLYKDSEGDNKSSPIKLSSISTGQPSSPMSGINGSEDLYSIDSGSEPSADSPRAEARRSLRLQKFMTTTQAAQTTKEDISSQLFSNSPRKSQYNKTVNSPGRTQLILDAGQKHLPASDIHEIQNKKLDNQTHSILKFSGWKSENLVREFVEDDSRVILVTPSSPIYAIKKVMDVNRVMAQELGFCETVLSSSPHYKVYLYVRKRMIIGCCVAESMHEGYRVVPNKSSQNHERAWICDSTPHPISVGIGRIWVHHQYRRRGIASKLLDCVRENFTFGSVIECQRLAFSDPTPDGMNLASRYSNRPDFLVYKFN